MAISSRILLSLILISASYINYVECYNILMICPAISTSHQILCNGIVETLNDNGHQITYVATFPSKWKNITEITIPFNTVINDRFNNPFALGNMSQLQMMSSFGDWQDQMADMFYQDERVRKLLDDKSLKFDLVFFEYMMNEAFIGVGVRFDCPVMLLAVDLMPWVALLTDNPLSLATVPVPMTSYSSSMTLYERTMNTVFYMVQKIIGSVVIERTQRKIYDKYMPEESKMVPFDELKYKIAMTVTDVHPSVAVARALLPNVIEIGGYHIGKPEPLPQDLQKILDSAKHGVIYFSMGSVLKSSQMDDNTKQAIMKALSNLKQTVLWKFEEDLPEKPNNVIIRKWMPQWSILAHPNVKLFISHGGLLSTTEAVHFGVPMVAIPIFGDQPINARKMADRSQGVVLQYKDITEETFTKSITQVLDNPIYAETTKKIKELFHDRPIKPRDLLNFSVNHVIKTKGAKHLSSPPLSSFAKNSLDVALVILTSLAVITYLSICLCTKLCCKRKNSQVKPKKE